MNSRSEKATIEYRWAAPSDQNELVVLKGKMDGLASASPEWVARWPWQFVDHPWRPEDCASNMVIALLENRIVGAIGCIPTFIEHEGKEFPSAIGCELFVDPEAQGYGLGQGLIDRIVERWPDSLWMNTPPAGARSYAKRGFDGVDPLNFRMLPVNPGRILRSRGRNLVGRLVGLAGPVVRSLIRLRFRRFPLPAGITIEKIERFGPEFDTLVEKLRRPDVVRPRRDAAFLQWRYQDCPFGPYTALAARDRGELVGFTVFRTKRGNNETRGILNELEADPQVPGLAEGLLVHALRELMKDGAHLITALPTETRAREQFNRVGFVDMRKTPYVYIAPGAASRLGLPLDGGRWAMSMGDCDVDMF